MLEEEPCITVTQAARRGHIDELKSLISDGIFSLIYFFKNDFVVLVYVFVIIQSICMSIVYCRPTIPLCSIVY